MSPSKKATNAGKNKTIDRYIGNANAGGADAHSGPSGGATGEPGDGAPDDKTRMFEMCQEIYKSMSASVLEKLDERFDAFEAKFQSVLAVQADLQNRMAGQELATNAFEEQLGELETKYVELTMLVTQQQTRLLDLEARSRRHNIKIVGIKENSEAGRPTELVSKLIPKLLGEQHFSHPLKAQWQDGSDPEVFSDPAQAVAAHLRKKRSMTEKE
ncbi:hypothetical protein GOODEAATRI_026437 [Goodea atripinnis]|uniref:Uncharacterized protein n=1 Tax=Goodea atripinnis TaxID=208336 RepID=A0ABV0MVB4_9TELE